MPGQPEVEQHDVGMVAGGQLQRLLPGLGEVDVVAAGARGSPTSPAGSAPRRRRRAPASSAASARPGRLTTIVTPPPGVSSMRQLAAHRLDEAAGDRQARARRRRRRRGGRRAAGTAGTRARGRRVGCRAAVDRPGCRRGVAVADDLAGGHPHRRAVGGETRTALATRLASARSSSAGSASDVGQCLGRRRPRPSRRRRRGWRPRRATTSSTPVGRSSTVQRRRLQAAHVEQVADERRQPVGLLLDRRLELVDRRPAASRRRAGAGWRSTP